MKKKENMLRKVSNKKIIRGHKNTVIHWQHVLWSSNIFVTMFLTHLLKAGKMFKLQRIFYDLVLNFKKLNLDFFTILTYTVFRLKSFWVLKMKWQYRKKKRIATFSKPLLLNLVRVYTIFFSVIKTRLKKNKRNLHINDFLLYELLLLSIKPNESSLIKEVEQRYATLFLYYKKYYRHKLLHYRW